MRMKDHEIETASDMADVIVGALGFAESEGVLTYGLTYDDDVRSAPDHERATFETEFAGRKYVVIVEKKKEEG